MYLGSPHLLAMQMASSVAAILSGSQALSLTTSLISSMISFNSFLVSEKILLALSIQIKYVVDPRQSFHKVCRRACEFHQFEISFTYSSRGQVRYLSPHKLRISFQILLVTEPPKKRRSKVSLLQLQNAQLMSFVIPYLTNLSLVFILTLMVTQSKK